MEYDQSNVFLNAGFRTVEQYDPQTYARMKASRWIVSTDPWDMMLRYGQSPFPSAFGTTLSDYDVAEADSFINQDMIESWAHDNGVHPSMFTAAVLVHEFRHIHQGHTPQRNEQQAFSSGSAFAAKLPSPDGQRIKELSNETVREMFS